MGLCHRVAGDPTREKALAWQEEKRTRQEKHVDSKGKKMAILEIMSGFPGQSDPNVAGAARCKGQAFWPSYPAPKNPMSSNSSYKMGFSGTSRDRDVPENWTDRDH